MRRTGAARTLCGLAALALAGPAAGLGAEHPLRVSEDGRHLVEADGRAFFYLGDTAWELFHRLDREEARRYLEDRAAKGFTVIQAVVLAERDGLRVPNPYGHLPLVDNDPRQPNPAYFEHVDFVVEQAEALGLTVGMLPTWGDKFHSRQHEPGPKVFDEANAEVFARFVGERYRERAVLFILGGDRNPDTDEDLAIIGAMGRALKATAPRNLVTYHPRGPGRSSEFFHGEDWLDFNMVQSSHTGRGSDNAVNVELDRALEPAKPTLDGEPRYEAIPIDFYMNGVNPALRFDAADVRTAAYRPLLAGAAGHTYGNNNVWQMWSPEHESVIWADTPWHEALDHPGAFQMGHLRRLFESRPWEKLVPDQGFVVSQNAPGPAFIRAAVASDHSFAFVHSPQGVPFVVDQQRLGAPELTYWWFDPRYGRAYEIHTGTGSGTQAFTPPSSGPGRDWVLVIDDPRKGFGPPGQTPGAE